MDNYGYVYGGRAYNVSYGRSSPRTVHDSVVYRVDGNGDVIDYGVVEWDSCGRNFMLRSPERTNDSSAWYVHPIGGVSISGDNAHLDSYGNPLSVD